MAHPLDWRPSDPAQPLLSTWFTLADLARVRRDVEQISRACGLDDEQAEDWITAVNELLINAIRHGGGQGRARLLLGDRLVCEVADEGPGFDISRYVPRADRPPVSDTGGMGLWLVGRMAEFRLVDSGSTGTTIRIAARSRHSARSD